MQITKITKLKNGKYKIQLDNKESITTYDDVVLKENLLYHKNIDLEKWKDLICKTAYYDVYEKIIRRISTRYRSLKEINDSLEKENITKEEKQNIIAELQKNGWIDDTRFTECYVSDRLHLSSDGPYLIYKKLLSYGIEETIIQSAIQKIDNQLFYEKAYKQVEKKVKSNKKYSKYILKQKIMQSLKEKGFEEKMILDILEICLVENKNVIEKEYQKIYKKLSVKYEGESLFLKIKQKLYAKGFAKEEIDAICTQNE